jgi:cell division protein FtsQ
MTGVRPPRSRGALATIALVAAAISAWVVVNSPVFEVRDLRIVGARNVPSAVIRERAAIESGANVFMLPTDDVAARVEEEPWILDAVVDRDLPSAIVIRVTERRPGGWLRDPNGFAIVAGDGMVVERSERRPSELPAVGEWPTTLGLGSRVEGFRAPLLVTSTMDRRTRSRVASATMEGSSVVVALRDGITVLYGEPSSLRAKHEALTDMLRWAESQAVEVRTIDVRVPSAPSLDPLGAATTIRPS